MESVIYSVSGSYTNVFATYKIGKVYFINEVGLLNKDRRLEA